MLKRGLLEFALKLPTNTPEFRYCYHGVIEEAQRSRFFHEFVARIGLDVRSPRILGFADRQVVAFGRRCAKLAARRLKLAAQH